MDKKEPFYFDFAAYFNAREVIQQAYGEDFKLPFIEIKSIEKTGKVNIEFSDTFLVLEDL